MMVGYAVEVSKHHCLSRGIYGAHAAEDWCGDTPSGVTTRIEVGGIRHVRLSRRDGRRLNIKRNPHTSFAGGRPMCRAAFVFAYAAPVARNSAAIYRLGGSFSSYITLLN